MISYGSIGTTISALCAQNAIESDRVARTTRDGMNRAALSCIEQRNAERETAHMMRTGQNAVQMAQNGVTLVMSCVQLGQAVGDLAEHQRVAPELERRFEAARADPSAREAFLDADMGSGLRVGDRFSEGEVDAMLAEHPTPEQQETLRRAGFDDREISGMSADVLGMHRATPAEKREAERESKIEEAFQTEIWKAVESCFHPEAASDRAGVLEDRAERIRTIADLFVESAAAHTRKLEEIDLDGQRRASSAAR